ncbi:MAG: ferredoxin [Acidobacteria bacterium]|nr:ferredoxin [Acidobacteriota bacterium]
MPVSVEQSTAVRGGWREQLRAFHLTGQGLEDCRTIPVPVAEADPRAGMLAETCGHMLYEARSAARNAFLSTVAREKARLEDLLRMDDSHSAASVTSESLSSALGAEGSLFLDPAALASALRRPQRPKGMAQVRRELIEWARHTLEDYLNVARGGAPFHIVAVVGDDPFGPAMQFDEALLQNMSEVQRALRVAHLECDSHEDATLHQEALNRVTWRSAKPDDLLAMPPVLALDSAALASGPHMASLVRLMRSGRPVVALAIGDAEDFATFDFGYQCLGFREACVLQSSLDQWDHAAAHLPQIALQTRPAAVFLDTSGAPVGHELFASCAFPHFFYNPASGASWKDRFSLLLPADQPASAASAALHSESWRSHFRLIPSGGWEEEQLEIGEYLARYTTEAPLAIPYLALPAEDGAPMRIALTRDLADACRDRILAWRLLEELAGIHNAYVESATAQLRQELGTSSVKDEAALVERVKIETVQKLVSVLMSSQPLPAGSLTAALLPPLPAMMAPAPPSAPQPPQQQAASVAAPEAQPEAASEDPYIDSFLCTSCNDCMKVNQLVFAYDGNKQAYIADAKAGTFAELVKAAEGCPAKCIHPGKPRPDDTSATPQVLARAAKLG